MNLTEQNQNTPTQQDNQNRRSVKPTNGKAGLINQSLWK